MASNFDPSAYGFQDAGDGRLFVPFSGTNYAKNVEGDSEGGNPNAGKYYLTQRTRTGTGEYEDQRQYYDNPDIYMEAVNKQNGGVPDISNIQYTGAGTNNPSYFSYDTGSMTPEQRAQTFGEFGGNKGYFIDPSRLRYFESGPNPSVWMSGLRDIVKTLGPAVLGANYVPGLGVEAGGAGAGASAGAGEAVGAGATENAAQGLQLTGSAPAQGMGGGAGLTAAGTGGGTGLQLTPATQSALNTGMSSALPNILGGSGAAPVQNVAQGLQLSPQTQQTLGTSPSPTGAPTTPTPGGTPPPNTGGQSFVDSIIEQLKKNAIPLSLAGLSAAQGARQRDVPNQEQQQAGGQAANQLGVDYINAARAGNLMPWQQSGLDQNIQNAKNQINQYFASIGQFDSTARMQALAQIDQQAQVMKGQLLQQTLSSGLQAIGVAQGPFNTIANHQLMQDRQLQEAMGNFARSVGGMFGQQAGKPTAAQPAPAGGGSLNTNPQPYITEQTPQNIQGNP
jgi:hypothetical protein